MDRATTHSAQRSNGAATSIGATAPLVDGKLQGSIGPTVSWRVAAACAPVSATALDPVERKESRALTKSRSGSVGDNTTTRLNGGIAGNHKLLIGYEHPAV